jgi:hypothetical protein
MTGELCDWRIEQQFCAYRDWRIEQQFCAYRDWRTEQQFCAYRDWRTEQQFCAYRDWRTEQQFYVNEASTFGHQRSRRWVKRMKPNKSSEAGERLQILHSVTWQTEFREASFTVSTSHVSTVRM